MENGAAGWEKGSPGRFCGYAGKRARAAVEVEPEGMGRSAWKPVDGHLELGVWARSAGQTHQDPEVVGGILGFCPSPLRFSCTLSGFGVRVTLASKTSWVEQNELGGALSYFLGRFIDSVFILRYKVEFPRKAPQPGVFIVRFLKMNPLSFVDRGLVRLSVSS